MLVNIGQIEDKIFLNKVRFKFLQFKNAAKSKRAYL